MNELNKKLAEWAGLFPQPDWRIWCNEVDKYYDCEVNLFTYPPYFTHSLDACFKWLVPKLYHTSLSRSDDSIYIAEASLYENDLTQEAYYEGNPALALCLAIEKLIDNA